MKSNSELFMLMILAAALTFILATITHIITPALFTPQFVILLFLGTLVWMVAPPLVTARRETAQ